MTRTKKFICFGIIIFLAIGMWEYLINPDNVDRAEACKLEPKFCTASWCGPICYLTQFREFLHPFWKWLGEVWGWISNFLSSIWDLVKDIVEFAKIQIERFLNFLGNYMRACLSLILVLLLILWDGISKTTVSYYDWAMKYSTLEIVVVGSVIIILTLIFSLWYFGVFEKIKKKCTEKKEIAAQVVDPEKKSTEKKEMQAQVADPEKKIQESQAKT
jgi:hypothetical protein